MRLEWANPRLADEQRMLKFERWLTHELRTHITWPSGPAGDKLLFQAQAVIRAQVRVLAERGWLLDSKALAEFLSKPIREIGELQKKHQIENIYAYFVRKWCRYVDERAEEIQDHANRIGHTFRHIGANIKTIPQLEEERHQLSLKDKLRIQRKKEAHKQAEKAQQRLFK